MFAEDGEVPVRVSLMVTCLGDALFPEVGRATVKILRRLGAEIDFPAAQTCCGQPQFNSGYRGFAQQLARHTIDAFSDSEIVVTPSGSCAAMVKLEYPELFEAGSEYHERALSLAGRTYELSEFLVRVMQVDDLQSRYPGKVCYHMSCHLRGLGIGDEPLRLLRKVRELELLPLDRCEECCGFGGSFSVRYPEISTAMVRDKAAAIEASGADAVVATDAGCLMNIEGYLRRRGSRVRGVHLATVLAGID